LHDGGDLPHEWLRVPVPIDDESLHLDWLSDEVLEGLLFEARQTAGYSKRCLTRSWDTMKTEKHIIRFAANGSGGCWDTYSLWMPTSSTTAPGAISSEPARSNRPIPAEESRSLPDVPPLSSSFTQQRASPDVGLASFFPLGYS